MLQSLARATSQSLAPAPMPSSTCETFARAETTCSGRSGRTPQAKVEKAAPKEQEDATEVEADQDSTGLRDPYASP